MPEFVDYIIHFDRHLAALVDAYGPWVYGLLFAIIFAETGLVVTPFLPGDSLLFAAGALAATGSFEPWLAHRTAVFGGVFRQCRELLPSAARSGPRVFRRNRPERSDAEAAQSTSIWNARTRSSSSTAARPSCSGGSCRSCGRSCRSWRARPRCRRGRSCSTTSSGRRRGSASASAAGLLFGNVPIVKNNFPLVALGIVIVSLLPAVYQYWKHRRSSRTYRRAGVHRLSDSTSHIPGPPARRSPQGSVIAASAEATASQGTCLAALAKVGRRNTRRRFGETSASSPREARPLRLSLRLRLPVQEQLFPLRAPPVTPWSVRDRHDPVTGHDERHGIRGTRRRDRPNGGRPADRLRNVGYVRVSPYGMR